jgi:hypothetical protein
VKWKEPQISEHVSWIERKVFTNFGARLIVSRRIETLHAIVCCERILWGWYVNGTSLRACPVAGFAICVVWFFWLHHDFTSRKLLRGKIYNAFTLTRTYLKNAYTSCTLMSCYRFISYCSSRNRLTPLVNHQFGKKTLLFPFASSKADRY